MARTEPKRSGHFVAYNHSLVYRLAYNGDGVAFKMGRRRSGGCDARQT